MKPQTMTEETTHELSQYFQSRQDVAFALLFGSATTGRQTMDSDVDVAVYIRTPEHMGLDVEADCSFPQEDEILAGVERIVRREVDLVVLNRAPATVAAAALYQGVELSVKDRALCTRFFLAATDLAEDFRTMLAEHIQVRKRSRSLNALDGSRLLRIIEYLRSELTDAHLYQGVDQNTYRSDSHLRRAMERWVENLVNASIDIGKIVVAAEMLPLPHTYRETMETLAAVPQFRDLAADLARNTATQNALAQEYLDLRYSAVQRAADSAVDLYGGLADATERWLENTESAG